MKPLGRLTLLCSAIAAFSLEARASAPDPWPTTATASDSGTAGELLRLRAPRSLMVRIPGATFRMGSTPDEVVAALAQCAAEPLGHRCNEEVFTDELHEHRVTVRSFWMDRTEVTVGAYQRCVRTGSCTPLPDAGTRRYLAPRYPVSFVTWYDAERYCEWRGARLPTEAEFELAARGPRGRRYPWGRLYNARVANHGRLAQLPTDRRDGYAELAPVGSFPSGRTPHGLLDLAGNVAEWTSDYYAPGYGRGPAVDPRGPKSSPLGNVRVVRGGHWANAAPWLRGAARDAAEASTRRPYIGFRCAKSASRIAPAARRGPRR